MKNNKKVDINKKDLRITLMVNIVIILIILIIILIVLSKMPRKVENQTAQTVNQGNSTSVSDNNIVIDSNSVSYNNEIGMLDSDLESLDLNNGNQKEIAQKYYNNFLNKLKNNVEQAYNIINPEYRNRKMQTIDNLNNYISNYNNIKGNRVLEQFQYTKYDSYFELVCIDNKGTLWIFDINKDKTYSVLLDSYTVSNKAYENEYNNSEDAKKAQLCLNRFFEAINIKDYETAYNWLNQEYRNNNFTSIGDFEYYVQANWFSNNMFSYSNIEVDDAGNYIMTGKISDIENEGSYDAKIVDKTFIVRLGNSISDFQMSFEK